MTNVNTDGLPPEMQARINQIIEQAKANVPAEQPAPAPAQPPAPPVVRQPSLMDHVIALRHEVADLKQKTEASMQVTDAVGQAVGQLYSMFQSQTQPSSFSTNFQTQDPVDNSDY